MFCSASRNWQNVWPTEAEGVGRVGGGVHVRAPLLHLCKAITAQRIAVAAPVVAVHQSSRVATATVMAVRPMAIGTDVASGGLVGVISVGTSANAKEPCATAMTASCQIMMLIPQTADHLARRPLAGLIISR